MDWKKIKGRFIVLDGPDGAGKSTQVALLKDAIIQNGLDVVAVRDPGGTRIGDKIRNILLDRKLTEMSVHCETLLYMASRAQLYSEVIAPALRKSSCVLGDRWVSSTYAYQAKAGGIGPEKVVQLAETSLERVWPDLTIILDVPSEQGLKRIGTNWDRMENKSAGFHRQVRQAFLELAHKRGDFSVVDGSGTKEQVRQEIEAVIEHHVFS